MKLSSLGYTSNWIKFKLLDETLFNEQMEEFKNGNDQSTEQFRYYTFVKWLDSKKEISDQDIDNYLSLAHEDEDQQMAGSAVRVLFTSNIITDEQFNVLKGALANFGDWTKKVIQQEVLKRRLNKEILTFDLYRDCLTYKNDYADSRLLVNIINQTENEEILGDFETNGCGKRIRTLACKKLNRVRKGIKS